MSKMLGRAEEKRSQRKRKADPRSLVHLPPKIREPSNMLYSMICSYKGYCDRRRAKEQSLIDMRSINTGADPIQLPHIPYPLYPTTSKHESNAERIAQIEVIKFLEQSFPAFSDFSGEDKIAVFRHSVEQIKMVECFILTSNYWPNSSDRFLASGITTFYDKENCDFYLCEEEDTLKKKGIKKKMQYYFQRIQQTIHPMLQTVNLRVYEYAALIALLVWSFETAPHISTKVQLEGERIQTRALQELERYYRERRKNPDYPMRIALLISIANTLQDVGKQIEQEFEIYSICQEFAASQLPMPRIPSQPIFAVPTLPTHSFLSKSTTQSSVPCPSSS